MDSYRSERNPEPTCCPVNLAAKLDNHVLMFFSDDDGLKGD